MAHDYISKANAARAATFYAAWKAVGPALAGSFRWLAEAHCRARLARKTYRTLQALSDRQLNDIGLSRHEISSVADAVAHNPPATGLSIAELRKVRPLTTGSVSAPAIWLLGSDERRRKRVPWAKRRPASTATDSERAAS